LFLGVEATVGFRFHDCFVARDLVQLQAKEGDSSTDFLLDLPLPVRVSLTVVLELVIGC